MFRVEYEAIPYLLTYLNFFLRFKDGITAPLSFLIRIISIQFLI